MKRWFGSIEIGALRIAVTQEFLVKLKGGKLLLAFIPKRGDAIVAAIAVSR